RVVHRRTRPLHLPHQRDAATRRRRLLASGTERRAVRQAQAALHTGGQVVVVERERHGSTCRPGASRPVGSKTCFTRRCSSTTTGSTVGRGGATARCTTPTPISARNGPWPSAANVASAVGRIDHR